ncbi:MAG: N-acetyltransferase [Bacteroidetes bacterium HGW-Bacteroidetes-16]|jgi:ribosomal protein S18 acetylase RimI-like enzyme|nr:MAG: N-acetyltransferase [Bacteroidetes bacterium HGW-Bacteroidetes-16]
MNTITLRKEVTAADPQIIREIVTSTGFFNDEEIDVAAELAEERLYKGEASGYEFIFLEVDGKTVAYSCYGLIPCTKNSYDLYWIATHHDFRNRGLGKQLLKATEEEIKALKGGGIYVETASRKQYTPTRMFYEKNGYELKAQFEDYYDKGDDLVYYVKRLG